MFLMLKESPAGIEGDVNGQGDEALSDDPQGDLLSRFTPGFV
jgi:hypothetical protein